MLFAKYGLHLPLNRQSAAYAREGIDLDVSTLADLVGAAAATLMPLIEVIHTHVFAAERIHADDTTVPVLAKGKTRIGGYGPMCATTGPLRVPTRRLRPCFTRVTAVVSIRNGTSPRYAGLMQADAYAGFNRLYEAGRDRDRSSKPPAGRKSTRGSGTALSQWRLRNVFRSLAFRPPSTASWKQTKPFVWTAGPDRVLAVVKRGKEVRAASLGSGTIVFVSHSRAEVGRAPCNAGSCGHL